MKDRQIAHSKPALSVRIGRMVSPQVPAWIAVITVLIAMAAPLRLSAQSLVLNAPRAEINLNGMWDYVLNQSDDHIPTSGWSPARIPEAPLADGTKSVWYKKAFIVPTTWIRPGRSFFVELEKAGHYAAVYCNGKLMGNHFGQFSPFEVEITSALVGGRANEIEIYVHKADTKYVRPGVNINQSSCPQSNPDCIADSYRPLGSGTIERNWVGLAGDITLSWRPSENISDVAIVTSVRNWTMQADLTVTGGNSGTTVQGAVLDGAQQVLTLPSQPVVSGTATLQASWTTPTLWGPPPYGQPKLYTLQTQVLQNGKVVDTLYTRFGFREVWVQNKDVLLNGQKMWMAADYWAPLSPIREVNDRRPQALMLFIMESSGLNGLSNHWDDPGQPWLDLADEMGIVVLGGFYCNGPDKSIQVDSATGWTGWMASTTQEWVDARRNHPSIVMWRPLDVLPSGVTRTNVLPQIDQALRAEDPSNRPIVDGTDVDFWAQSNQSSPGHCDDGSKLAAKLASETKPLLVKEIYGNWTLPCTSSFFDTFYQKDYVGGGTGLIPQNLPLFQCQDFTPSWFSISGQGNRPTSSQCMGSLLQSMPDWTTRLWNPTNWSTQFANLYQTYVQPNLLHSSPTSGEYQASGLPTSAVMAFLVPSNPIENPIGVLIAPDGTAWFVVPQPGNYKLVYDNVVQDVTVYAPQPF